MTGKVARALEALPLGYAGGHGKQIPDFHSCTMAGPPAEPLLPSHLAMGTKLPYLAQGSPITWPSWAPLLSRESSGGRGSA